MPYKIGTQSVVPKPPVDVKWREPWTLRVQNELSPWWMWDKKSVPAYSEPGATTRGYRGILPSASAKISNLLNPHSNSGAHIFCNSLRGLEGERYSHGTVIMSLTADVWRSSMFSLFLYVSFNSFYVIKKMVASLKVLNLNVNVNPNVSYTSWCQI